MSVTGKTEVAELVLPRGPIFGDVAQPKQSVYEESATANYAIGTPLIYGDGRVYRYAKTGAIALVKALMTHAAIPDADLNAEDQTGNYPVVGDTTIVVEIGTGVALLGGTNELAGSTLCVNAGTGIGDCYQVLGSKIGTTDTNMSLIIDSPIRTTWTTSSNITIKPSPWTGTLVQSEPAASQAAGVPNIATNVGYYYWSQIGGPCGIVVDTDETIVIGDLVGAPATQTIAGAAGVWVTLTTPWGTAMSSETTQDQVALVYLSLPGC